MKMHKVIVGVVACTMLCSVNGSYGFNAESYEYDSPDKWDIPDAADSAGMSDPLDIYFLDMLDGADTPIRMDFLSESRTDKGRSSHDDGLKLALGKDNELTFLDEPSGDKGNGSFSAVTWDATSWIDSVLDAGLTNSDIAVPLFLGTWADDGVSNVYMDNIASIPEPATYGLITIFGGSLLLFRRRFKS